MSPSQCVHPVVFEQRYVVDPSSNSNAKSRRNFRSAGSASYAGVHVFVLVHGFQGNSFDMRLMKNIIALLYPNALYLCSTANEDDTDGDIEKMGKNLANEVTHFVQDWCADAPEPSLGRLSFVTHSVGGLIVRSALPYLEEYKSKMFTFLSFSSPHLGYIYAANSLFTTGLWVAKKLRNSKCLEQLSMTDADELDDSFLSRLAHRKGLEHFQHIALVSSYQDQYAPYESARIEMSALAGRDLRFGPFYSRMLKGLLGPLKPERILRLDVHFHIPETNLDTVIGRAAHIQFIESEPLMRMLVHTHGFLFE